MPMGRSGACDGVEAKDAGDTVLFESAGTKPMMWEEKFPKWNADNLETGLCSMVGAVLGLCHYIGCMQVEQC